MRHLFSCWDRVAARLRAAAKIALFLDFDGTLARLRPRPEEVWLDPAGHRLLATLARSPRFHVVVISGRRWNDIRERMLVRGIHYRGLHGSEGPKGLHATEESEAILAMVRDLLPRAFANCAGIWIEDKGAIIAIHYREATRAVQTETENFLRGLVDGYAGRLRLSGGKHIWEIIPRELEDKGAAVRRELASLSCRVVPVYVGDDVVDEPAFAVLDTGFNRGVTVRVGRRAPTRAHFGLANVAQVRMFLEKLRAEFI